MKIFCLASAGAQASMYSDLKKAMGKAGEIIPIEYPGHGTRMSEPLIGSMKDLVGWCEEDIKKQLKDKSEPFMLLGHSMGSIICYQLENLFKSEGYNLKKVVLAACQAPNFWLDYIGNIEEMDNKEFLEYVASIGGVQEELLDNEFFKEIYTDIIRNDFVLLKRYVPQINKVETPLVLINGNKDQLVGERWKYWQLYSQNETQYFQLDENHFVVKDTNEMRDILKSVS